MKLILLALLFCCPVCLKAQEQPDFSLDKWSLSVRKLTPDLLELIETQQEKPPILNILGECDQSSFEAACQWDWIEKIYLDLNEITDLSPITGMTGLKHVELKFSGPREKRRPVDLNPFKKLTNLESISCAEFRVINTQGLAGLKHLKKINFNMGEIESLDYLRETPSVELLQLSGHKHTFEDYHPLLALKNLKRLELFLNSQAIDENLAVLNGLTTLDFIDMTHNSAVTTLDFLENCRGMKTIWCRRAFDLVDMSALEKMPDLENLEFNEVPLKDISFLKGKTALKRLNLEGTGVVDLSPLLEAESLEFLSVERTGVSDLAALRDKHKLSGLLLDQTKVSDISPLAGSKSLSSLVLSGTGVTDFSALESCPELSFIQLPHSATDADVNKLKEKIPKADISVEPKPE